MVDTQTYWNQCLQIFKDNVSAKEYETWFAHIAPLSYENKVLTLQVPSMFVAEVLEDKYIDLLSKAIQRIIGKTPDCNTGLSLTRQATPQQPYPVKHTL